MFRRRPKRYKTWLDPEYEGEIPDATSREHAKRKRQAEGEQQHENGQLGESADDDTTNPITEGPEVSFHQDQQTYDGLGNSPNAIDSDDEQDRGEYGNQIIQQANENQGLEFNVQDAYNSDGGDSDGEDFIFHNTEKFFDKYDLSCKLGPNSDTTKFEAYLMILFLSMRYGMTGRFITDLIRFANKINGSPVLRPSKYLFKKLFSVHSSLEFHFVCESCFTYLGENKSFSSDTIKCPNCGSDCNVRQSSFDSKNFFVTLSVQNQLQDLVDRCSGDIMPHLNRNNDDIKDMMDGELYKSLTSDGMPLSNPHSLSLTINTDGSVVYKGSKNSLWPLTVVCNELGPEERFKPENIMLAALWFGKSEPPMSAFLKPLGEELKVLGEKGIKRKLGDEEINCPAYAISCVCDSKAKPKLQNIVSFSGFYGCGYCLHPGSTNNDANQVRYPSHKSYKYRKEEDVRQDMVVASESGMIQNGIKGYSPLLHIPTMHLVFGIPIDFMHCILLGVTKRLITLWFDEKYSDQPFSIRNKESEVGQRLKCVTLPMKLYTRCCAFDQRVHWKAKDYGYFLLFLGLAVLKGILPDRQWNNLKDLSEGVYILLKKCITKENLENARLLLSRFVSEYNILYGDNNMVYNVHLITHVTDIVKLCGPLFAYSAFAFESFNGLLVRLVKGTTSTTTQICSKFMATKSLYLLLERFEVAEGIKFFCEKLVDYDFNKQSRRMGGVVLLGSVSQHLLTEEEQVCLRNAGFDFEDSVYSYNRAIFRRTVYVSTAYKRLKRCNDTCVQLDDGTYGVIELIFEWHNEAYIFVRLLRTCPDYNLSQHLITCAGNLYGLLNLVPFSLVRNKGILVQVPNRCYVSTYPNQCVTD